MVIIVTSCNKEKRYQSKIIGTWDIYEVVYSTNYYELDSIVIDNTIADYGEIVFTKDETSVQYQTLDVAYEGSLMKNNVSIGQPSTTSFVYEVFEDYIVTHDGLLEIGDLYFDFDSKKEMSLVTGVNYDPGGTTPIAYQTTYSFRKK